MELQKAHQKKLWQALEDAVANTRRRMGFCWKLSLGSLQHQADDLAGLSASMDGDFALLSRHLQGLSELSGKIAQESQNIVVMASGQQGAESAMSFAYFLFKKSADLTHAADEEHSAVLARLEQLEQQIVRLLEKPDELARMITYFSSITVRFRVEAQYLEPATREKFLSLAASIESLYGMIREDIVTHVATLQKVQEAISKALRAIRKRLLERREKVLNAVVVIQGSLQKLDRLVSQAGRFGQSLGETQGQINAHLGSMIMAGQVHDITRQKLEHVVEAFTRLHESSQSRKWLVRLPSMDLVHDLREVLPIQHRQLQGVAQQLLAAGETIEKGTCGIQKAADHIATQAIAMVSLNARGDGSHGIIEGFLRELTLVVELVGSAVKTNEELHGLIQPLVLTVSDFTKRLKAFSTDIRNVALNAQIQAARIPEAAVMEVTAEQTRRVADQTLGLVRDIATGIEDLRLAREELLGRLESFGRMAGDEQRVLESESQEACKRLVVMRDEFDRDVEQLVSLNAMLTDSTEQMLDSIGFPQRASALIEQVCRGIENLQDHPDIQQPTGELRQGGIAETLRATYTMDDERSIHDQSSSPAASTDSGSIELFGDDPPSAAESPGVELFDTLEVAPAESAAPAAKPPAAADLGDNVELF